MQDPAATSRNAPPGLPPPLVERFMRCRRIFAETAESRVTFPKLEDPIRAIEQEFREHPPRKGRFRAVLADSIRLVGAANAVHGPVRDKEKEATELLAELRQEVQAKKRAGGPELVELESALAEWARLRTVEREWLDGVLQHSHMLVNLPPDTTTPVQLYTLLQQRRTYMERVNSLLAEAEVAERKLARGAPAKEEAKGAGSKGREAVIRDKKWEEWLGKVKSSEGKETPEGNGKELAVKTKDEPAAPAKESGMSAPFERLTRMVDALKESVQTAHADAEKVLEEERARLEADHAKVVAARDEAEKKLTNRIQGLTDERDESRSARKEAQRQLEETRTKLTKTEGDLTARTKERDELTAKAKADAKTAADRIAELTREAKAAADQIGALKKARDDAKSAFSDLETKVKAEREELAKQKKKAEDDVKSANQERDEALILITSLTKRLGTPSTGDAKK